MVFAPQGKRTTPPESPNARLPKENSPALPRESAQNPALAPLQEELRQLRLRAGQPSFRAIAKDLGWSHTTIARAFTGENAPKWDLLAALTTHLGGDGDRLRALWVASMDTKPKPEATVLSAAPAAAGFPFITAIASICALLVVVALRDLAPSATHRNELITSVAQLLFATTAAVLWWGVVAKRRGRENLAIAICLSGWALGAAVQIATPDVWKAHLNTPSPIDIVSMCLPSALFLALLASALQKPRRLRAAAALAVLLPIWFTLLMLGFSVHAETLPTGTRVAFALFSAMYVAGFFLIARIALLRRDPTWALVLLGSSVLIVSHVVAMWVLSARLDRAIPVGAVIGYLVCPLILIVAARCATHITRVGPSPQSASAS